MNKVTPKESWVQASQAVLCQIIRAHQKQRRWHYGVFLAADNPNSLASLLQLTQSEADMLLTSMQLMRIDKNGRKVVLIKKWNSMLVREGLSDHVYFDRMYVSNIPSGRNDDSVIQWYGVWIGVGGLGEEYKKKLNPKSQFENNNNPPKIRQVHKLLMKLKEQLNELDDSTDDGNNDTRKRTNAKTSIGIYEEMKSVHDEMINDSLEGSIMNVSLLLDDLMSGKTNKAEVLALITGSLKESIVDIEQKRRQSYIELVM